ncbi:tail fiber assembly protein [Klebsiella pneumoniae]|uniref:tail fiber assembly protein n=1 Tax=Enterobacteriaceae TaxID=543 RepID=UPI001CF4CD6A|nr:tail fiber assembly protein [Kluyvera ascorbata]MCB3987371.1 tail fiber assembly protein [Klebsiella pneumoniae]HCQ6557102.1 tail fiber assembly protein [Escherichia coli]HBS1005284.1 tail fiber assembly protein [Klebsiella pneumoniae]HBS1582927.1 tail fiber assembly protein [Klebsiella pneumoniae]HBS1657169.1 tail fiber assembly protein [Klebsiella pneumoniae]
MAEAQFNGDMIAVVAGEITVYNFDGSTREYLSSSVEYIAVGIGLPAHSCIDAPGESKEGFAICRTADLIDWKYVADHRGKITYNKETGQPLIISDLGDYPSDLTPEAPTTPYDKWDGQKWVTDSVAKRKALIEYAEEQRLRLLTEVDDITSDWRVELMLGDISESDKAKLSAWMAYKSEVKAVDVSTAPDVTWPVKPEAQAS